MARHLASIQGLRKDSGIHEEHPSEGSLIHVAVNKSFMSCKNANSSKQPPKVMTTALLLQASSQPATVLS